MVINAHSKDRRPDDAYYTPPALADAIWASIGGCPPSARVLEPHGGGGAFLTRPREAGAQLDVVDCNATDPGWFRMDFLEFNPLTRYDIIIGNPPYLGAAAHIRHAMSLLDHGGRLVFLLRLSILASEERLSLWQDFPLDVMSAVVPRPSFTENGKTDGTEYAVFRWVKGGGRGLVTAPLVWAKPKRKRGAK